MEKSKMKKSKMILMLLAILIVVAGNAKAQDGSEYLLWEKTKDFTTIDVAISPDETQIAVSAEYTDTYPHTYSIKILSILSGEELYSIPIPNPGYPIFYTTDGKYLVDQGNGETNIIFDAKTYKKVKELPSGGITFSTDNNFLSLAVTGYKFEILNSETFEIVYEKNLTKPADGEKGFYEVFFTPNSKYLVTNVTTYFENHYSERKIFQEIYDAKTFQKIDKTINCLKNYGTFSNNGLCANTFPKDEKVSTQPIGFRIYDYENDSLIWEQETAYIGSMNFIRNTDYLLTLFQPYINDSEYEKTGNCRIWDLKQNKLKNKFPILSDAGVKLSINSRFLTSLSNGISTSTIRMYDFTRIFNDYVSVNEPNKTIEININTLPDSNLIRLSNLSNDIISITIYDLSGNLIGTISKGVPIGNSLDYNTSHLAKGLYIVKIDTKQESLTKKIIIE
jgi:hypothetical protein